MNKEIFKYLVSAMCLLPLCTIAQPLAGSFFYPVAGETWSYSLMDTTGNFTATGAQTTWSFSLMSDSVNGSENYLTVTQDPAHNMFPGSHLVRINPNGNRLFIDTTAGYNLKGSISGTDTIVYTDPRLLFNFPLAFNTIYHDTFAGTQFNASGSTPFTGRGTYTYDGYGDLHLPWVSLTEVIRTTKSDSFFVAADTNVTNTYTWYYGFEKFPVMEVSETRTNGNLVLKEVRVNTTYVSIKELEGAQAHVFPNPGTGLVFFTAKDAGELSVYDIAGKLIMSGTQLHAGENLVDLTHLPAGIYFLQAPVNGAFIQRYIKHD